MHICGDEWWQGYDLDAIYILGEKERILLDEVEENFFKELNKYSKNEIAEIHNYIRGKKKDIELTFG